MKRLVGIIIVFMLINLCSVVSVSASIDKEEAYDIINYWADSKRSQSGYEIRKHIATRQEFEDIINDVDYMISDILVLYTSWVNTYMSNYEDHNFVILFEKIDGNKIILEDSEEIIKWKYDYLVIGINYNGLKTMNDPNMVQFGYIKPSYSQYDTDLKYLSIMEGPKNYIDYLVDVREIQRGKQNLTFGKEIYYYMAQVQAFEKESNYMDKPITGTLSLINVDENEFFVGDPVFNKVYKKDFKVVGPKDNYSIKNGDFGIMGGKFYSNPPKRDILRFIFVPDDDYNYRPVFFSIDFNLMDEELRNGFIIDSTKENYQLPDDINPEDIDENMWQGATIGENDLYNPGDGSIWYVVQDFLVTQFNEIFSKFSDITDIFVALKLVIKGSLENEDWEGIKVNFAGADTLLSGEYTIVAPGPINNVRQQLRVFMAGGIYLITAIFVIRKAKDIF